ncbi:hypothetical protein [Bacillus horti]|uniref:Helicase XPB/Ssl2 N-terminal domain-containing protein n=1 Tax=Caldalkalibacillus horti TaxID=77523 RepID=A0ABT9W3N2_9BACI|nr:hypothetical protein [Bacillus horti]MDQ0167863.1 hypothetical protein [Bacillus horti]
MRQQLQSCLEGISISNLLAMVQELPPIFHGLMDEEEKKLRGVLQEKLQEQTYIQEIYKSLSPYEKDVLRFFIFHVGRDFLSYRQIDQEVQGIKSNLFRLGLVGLRQKGLIYSFRRQWGEEAYIFPVELELAFYKYLIATSGIQSEPVLSTDTVHFSVSREREDGIKPPVPAFQWMFSILDDLRQTKEGKITLTQKGTLHKRVIRRWEELWDQQPLSLKAFDLSVDQREVYSNQLAVLLDYFTVRKLIYWTKHELHVQITQIDAFMQGSRAKLMGDFRSYFLERFKPKTSWMYSYLRDAGLAVNEQHSFPLLQFVEQWEEHYPLPPVSELLSTIKEELIDPLHMLGLVEYRESKKQELCWRWLYPVEGPAEVWVQPNLECFCSALTPLPVLWRLTDCLEMQGWDSMIVLKLSLSRLSQAIEHDLSIPKWLDWLATHSKQPIPEAFLKQMQEWAKKTRQVSVSTIALFHIQDAQLLQAVLQFCQNEQIKVHVSTTACIGIDKLVEERVQLFLAQNQISVYRADEKGKQFSHEEKEERPSLINFGGSYAGQLRVENVFPDLTEAIPGWKQLPELWRKQMLPYHDQTKKEIVEKAIQHQLLVQYEAADGEIVRIHPVTSQTIAGEWVCVAEKRGKIPLREMQRMQLLFPVLQKKT